MEAKIYILDCGRQINIDIGRFPRSREINEQASEAYDEYLATWFPQLER